MLAGFTAEWHVIYSGVHPDGKQRLAAVWATVPGAIMDNLYHAILFDSHSFPSRIFFAISAAIRSGS